MDVPDGDIEIGKRVFDLYCAGCHHMYKNHSLGPMLHNIFGKSAGTQKGYKMYSHKNRALAFQWSKQRLYHLLGNFFLIIEYPEEVLGILSNMTFNGLYDSYERACIIEYLHHMRIHTSKLVKPEWVNIETD